MIRVLITGKNSYVGNQTEAWLRQYDGEFEVNKVSLREQTLEEISFASYDVVLHVAGIAHVNAKENMEKLYYQVNRDLTVATAKKAKKEGVRQFIFLSSIIVYGENNKKNSSIEIKKETKPSPSGFYGNSKLQAEQGILRLEDPSFQVVIVRPPMIYGPGSKGNYKKLAKLARKTTIFPCISNQRSMIYIANLCELLRLIMIEQGRGIFYPQNAEYVNTTQLVKEIAKVHGRTMYTTRMANPFLWLAGKCFGMVNKVVGTLIYDKELSNHFNGQYQVVGFQESIRITEGCCEIEKKVGGKD